MGPSFADTTRLVAGCLPLTLNGASKDATALGQFYAKRYRARRPSALQEFNPTRPEPDARDVNDPFQTIKRLVEAMADVHLGAPRWREVVGCCLLGSAAYPRNPTPNRPVAYRARITLRIVSNRVRPVLDDREKAFRLHQGA